MPETRRGAVLGVVAYALWGLFPLYWSLLESAGAVEILSHRVVWSLVLVGGLLAARSGPGWVRALRRRPRALALSALASVVIAVNWGTYIWGVNSGHVVEASLGYFINPLVTVVLGVVVLGERLRRAQWAAVGVAAVAVTGLTVDYGRPPWLALVLASTFAVYGLLKKTTGMGAVEGLAVETAVLAPLALGYLAWLAGRGDATFGAAGTGHALLLIGSGAITAVPLLLFGAAARLVPLTVLGLLQYLAPTIQFLLGVLLYGESMPAARLAGFAVLWSALALFAADAVAHRRRARVAAPVPEPVAA